MTTTAQRRCPLNPNKIGRADRLNFRITDEQLVLLRAEAARLGTSMSEVARAALAAYCAEHEARVA